MDAKADKKKRRIKIARPGDTAVDYAPVRTGNEVPGDVVSPPQQSAVVLGFGGDVTTKPQSDADKLEAALRDPLRQDLWRWGSDGVHYMRCPVEEPLIGGERVYCAHTVTGTTYQEVVMQLITHAMNHYSPQYQELPQREPQKGN